MSETLSERTSPSPAGRMIFGAVIASVAFVMELTLVPLLLPSIQTEMGLTLGQLTWLFNSYGIAVAVGVLVGGWLGDILNTKLVFCAGTLLFAAGAGLVAVAGPYETVVLGRTIQGLGGGIFTPTIPLLLTRASPRQPGKILIVSGSVVGYVAASAPFLYGSILLGESWRFAFVTFACVSLIGLVFVLRSEKTFRSVGRPDEGPNYLKLIRSPKLAILFVYVFCTYGAITFFLFRLPLFLSEKNFDAATIGISLSVLWLSFSFVSTLLRNLVDRPGVGVILFSAPVLIALGFPLAYLSENVPSLIFASVMVGSGLACGNAPSTQLILNAAPRAMRTASVSLDITFARLGGVFCVATLAATSTTSATTAIAALSLIALVCAFLTARTLGADRK